MNNPVAPVVTDEMLGDAIRAYNRAYCTKDQVWDDAMRAAITAALEASGEIERLRAENEKLRVDRGFAIGWIKGLANNPHKPMTWMQTREAAADFVAALEGSQ